MNPDGSGSALVATLGDNVPLAVPDPNTAGSYIFAARLSPGGQLGIYRGTTLNPGSATRLVTPRYDIVSSIQATSDGTVFYIAGDGSQDRLYSVTIGTNPITISNAYSAHINSAETRIAISRPSGTVTQLVVYERNTSTTRVLVNSGQAIEPQFTKDGSAILFAGNQRTDASFDIFKVSPTGGTPTAITATDNASEFSPTAGPAEGLLAYLSINIESGDTSIVVEDQVQSTKNTVLVDYRLANFLYWSGLQGRSRFGASTLPLRRPHGRLR